MNVIIAGGRDFSHYDILCDCCDYVLGDAIQAGISIKIISGRAKGADTLGEKYAKDRRLALEYKPADWNQYGKSAGYLRNLEMANIGNVCICFWDGKSKGTKHMIDIAKQKHLQLFVFDYEGNYKAM